jgi:hypothetical protein
MKQKRNEPKLLHWVVAAFILAVFLLGIWWLLWTLWTYVLPQIWPTGPEGIIRPGYWLFVAGWVLLGFIGRRIFGRKQ